MRVGREIHEKLLDLPDGLVFFSSGDVEVDESEGCEIAGKTAREGVTDLIEGFFVGRFAGQIADAVSHVFRLVVGSQGHFIEPRLYGAGRVLFLRVEIAAQPQGFSFRAVIFGKIAQACQYRQGQIEVPHRCVDSGLHQLASLCHL